MGWSNGIVQCRPMTPASVFQPSLCYGYVTVFSPLAKSCQNQSQQHCKEAWVNQVLHPNLGMKHLMESMLLQWRSIPTGGCDSLYPLEKSDPGRTPILITNSPSDITGSMLHVFSSTHCTQHSPDLHLLESCSLVIITY
jgi:hypothetical protein